MNPMFIVYMLVGIILAGCAVLTIRMFFPFVYENLLLGEQSKFRKPRCIKMKGHDIYVVSFWHWTRYVTYAISKATCSESIHFSRRHWPFDWATEPYYDRQFYVQNYSVTRHDVLTGEIKRMQLLPRKEQVLLERAEDILMKWCDEHKVRENPFKWLLLTPMAA